MSLPNIDLAENGELTPVMWKGYIDRIKAYQGELSKKGSIQKKFDEKFKKAQKEGVDDLSVWCEMN